jgi:hypothetical protein
MEEERLTRTRLDLRTLIALLVATLIGAAWATYQRGLAIPPYDESELRPLVWVIFATPFALFIGWFFARRTERWWAAFVCFCLYFFSPFVAQRYESCTIVSGGFSLSDCFLATAQAQELSAAAGHVIYFQAVVVIQVAAGALIAIHRAMGRPMAAEPAQPPALAGEPTLT